MDTAATRNIPAQWLHASSRSTQSGQTEAGIAAAEELVKRQTARNGENSFDTASARGMLAVGYARAGRDADAIREFKAAIPIMMAAARENADNDDPTIVAARSVRLQRIVEGYISLLARSTAMSKDVAVETFALADAVRGHAVQQSLADSSARTGCQRPGACRTRSHRAGSRQTDQRRARHAQQYARLALGPTRRAERARHHCRN